MNPQVLMIIDHQLNPKKYTKEQLMKNADSANNNAAAYAAADTAAYAAYVDAAADTAYCIDRYFKHTGENKQDYIDAINKDNKQ